jgi:hypothetical protein
MSFSCIDFVFLLFFSCSVYNVPVQAHMSHPWDELLGSPGFKNLRPYLKYIHIMHLLVGRPLFILYNTCKRVTVRKHNNSH